MQTQETLELQYCKRIRKPNENYVTWYWYDCENSNNYGWHKRIVHLSVNEVAGKQSDKNLLPEFATDNRLKSEYYQPLTDFPNDAKQWFKVSNTEDLIFLNKEKQAFNEWYDKEYKEIIKNMKHQF